MHFAPAIPAGRALCAGMGSQAASVVKSLIPGLADGTASVRGALAATAPCEATCCAEATKCTALAEAACAANCTRLWDLPWFDVVEERMKAFSLPDRSIATVTDAPFFRADRNHIVILFSIIGSTILEVMKAEPIFQMRYTQAFDNLIWNSFAANSDILMAMQFGQGHAPAEPTIRSGQRLSDARVVTAVHAVAAALPLLLPAAAGDFQESLGYALLSPRLGIDAGLVSACGAPESSATAFSAVCMRAWYAASPGPSRLGQTVAYEVMFFRLRDGWNSQGTDGGCDAGAHFCHPYSDVTGYDPESGACLDETLTMA